MDKKATLQLPDGKSLDLPMMPGSVGPEVIDVRALYGKTGYFTYDPGVLLYRGYPIEQLAQHCDFLEVCYLLLNGELTNQKQKDEFVDIVTHHTMVHEQLARLYQGFRRDAHPMAV